jgi:prepilin-type N-terminal cleavage/methylation domain-containing protein/prepilin-type processing-associated H-X9-DG protein
MRRRGFTLVELLVVIAIIGVLAAILLPALSRSRQAAKRTFSANNLRQIWTAIELYKLEHRDTYPAAANPMDADNPYLWLWMGRGFRELLAPYVAGSGNNPSIYWDPSDSRSENQYDSTSYAYSMAFYISPIEIDSIPEREPVEILRTQFCWNGADPSRVLPVQPQTDAMVHYPTKKILAGEWYANHAAYGTDGGWFRDQNGDPPGGKRLYVFADGHVEYLATADLLPAWDGLGNPNLTKGGITGKDVP